MKQKKIWICIACFALLVCCLAVFSTLGHKQGKTDSELSTRDESADLEFPEIEIPDEKSHAGEESTDNTQSPGGSTVKSSNKKDSTGQSSDTSKPAGKSSEAEDVQKDTSGKKQSNDTGKKTEDAISKDSHEESKKDTSSEGSEDKNSQSKPETKQDSEGPVIEDNGDILLPEVP